MHGSIVGLRSLEFPLLPLPPLQRLAADVLLRKLLLCSSENSNFVVGALPCLVRYLDCAEHTADPVESFWADEPSISSSSSSPCSLLSSP